MINVLKIGLTAMVVSALTLSCGQRKQATGRQQAGAKAFPAVEVPAMLSDPSERLDYILAHFWDGLNKMEGECDSLHIEGVLSEDVEKQFGTYTALLWQVPVNQAAASISSLFRIVENYERRDTSSNVFEKITDFAKKYFYDPNSPLRNEEFYLAYLKGLTASEFVPESMKPAYGYEMQMCSLNRVGEKAADFSFRDLAGRNHRLYDVKADYILLFFSNPGCPNCLEITQMIESSPEVSGLEKSGRLKVVNVYIDQEIDKWKEYASEYPEEWLCGYDNNYIIRTDVTYNVRAIPSLYLLDADKKVLMKDAPQDKIFEALQLFAMQAG